MRPGPGAPSEPPVAAGGSRAMAWSDGRRRMEGSWRLLPSPTLTPMGSSLDTCHARRGPRIRARVFHTTSKDHGVSVQRTWPHRARTIDGIAPTDAVPGEGARAGLSRPACAPRLVTVAADGRVEPRDDRGVLAGPVQYADFRHRARTRFVDQ